MSKLVGLAYALVLGWEAFKGMLKRHSTNIGLTVLMVGVVGVGSVGAYKMHETGKEHEIDALYLEEQYLEKKRSFARNCLKEGRGFAAKGEQMNPEVIEACENMATAMYPDKDFSKVAMLNWERQQLGIVIYESDEDR
jgi:hypothetical protein